MCIVPCWPAGTVRDDATKSIPATIPYLHPDPELTAVWRDRIGTGTGLRVGIVWAGNAVHKNDRNRSVGLERLRTLFDLPDISWFGLQIGPRAADLKEGPSSPVVDLSPEIKDFADTAAASRTSIC